MGSLDFALPRRPGLLVIDYASLTLRHSTITSRHNMISFLKEGGAYSFVLPVPSDFVVLRINYNIVSDAPILIAVVTSSGEHVWSSGMGTVFIGEDTIKLSGPATYYIIILNLSITLPINVRGWINITMNGSASLQTWVSVYTQLRSTPLDLNMAPMGIAAYGVVRVNDQYYGYVLTTNAVRGVVHVPNDVVIECYDKDGKYLGNAFSIQLNAHVVVQLADGSTQYYWVQNTVGLVNGSLYVSDNVWNTTQYPSDIDSSAIHGNGKIYYAGSEYGYIYAYIKPDPILPGRITLEIRAYVIDGKVIIDLYVNDQLYDSVTIKPDTPADLAFIEIAPTTTPNGTPLDLELVFGGLSGDLPYVILKNGSINMNLYVNMDGKWVSPPSAWSVGYSTFETAHAQVVPLGAGSVRVVPGEPSSIELWSIPVDTSASGA